ncbi:alginate export family protein [Methylicorpusculum sp.]|uniref:alginate export family protein n=2 Tax=Methylicorpusculum sp. TaxID=2713644 RepID=UPI002731616E|nr:alginate export family protein [Methylicorpusculum sp.]
MMIDYKTRLKVSNGKPVLSIAFLYDAERMANSTVGRTRQFPSISLAVIILFFTPIDDTHAAQQKPVTPPFACFSSQMNDHLAQAPNYEKPVWNLHDTLKLPQWLSLSLEQRTRYEVLGGQFQANAKGGDQQIPLATCLSLEASFNDFRLGAEFMDSRQFGSDSGSTLNNTHANQSDFLQAYLAWAQTNFLDSGIGTEVILGRQTLNLGSRRLVARNVFRNTINAFTGARFRFQDNGKWQFNGFVTLPVGRYPNEKQELLDSKHEWDTELYKTWFSGGFLEIYDIVWKINAELFLYHLSEDDQNENDTRNRRLFTPGMRWYRKPAKGEIDFQVETAGQLGTIRATTEADDTKNLDHQAWFQHLSLGYTLELPWSPRFVLQYDYASGESNPNDDKNERFDTLFGARRFEYSPTGIYGAIARSNINSPGTRLIIAPRDNVEAFISHRLIWLAESRDTWTASALRDRSGASGDFLGHQIELSTRWNVNSSFNLETGWTHLFKGDFARDAPNAPDEEDVDYFYVQSLFRF